MNMDFLGKTQFVKPRHLFFIFLVMAVLMISSALIELNQSKKELLDLMQKQAHTALETILLASHNTLMSNIMVEEIIEERLLNNANVIRTLYEKGQASNSFLEKFARENHIYRINIFNKNGKKVYFSHQQIHTDLTEEMSPGEILKPIFRGKKDTLLLGLKQARQKGEFRFAVALAARDRSAIVLNLNADQLLEFRRQIGFGSLLRNMVRNPGILYAALQDTSGILAASGNVRELDRITDSPFLYSALTDSTFRTRIAMFDSAEVLEAVHPFYFQGEAVGLFRLGLSLKPLQAIKARIYRRIVFISIVLLLIGFILFTFLLVRQNLDILRQQYQVVETYSGNIIQNVSDAIIVLEENSGIRIFNKAAEALFDLSEESVIGKPLEAVFDPKTCREFYQSDARMQELHCEISGKSRYLLTSRSRFRNPDGKAMTILVIRDLTQQKHLEAQVQRRERLSAMGQLASGVAHEIRNPLNAIGTIIQQLDRDFEPRENSQEYHQLARLIYQEVKRINETIESFLRFARPEPLKPERFDLLEFLQQFQSQYLPILQEKNIEFTMDIQYRGEVKWDRHKMQQVFINLMENAIDALPEGGKIALSINSGNGSNLEIHFRDNGPGIPAEVLSKIFNLYFTTKDRGTGIGLAIVQRIVDQHGGVITVESETGEGTVFIINMPVEA